jgi:hypothetical protein
MPHIVVDEKTLAGLEAAARARGLTVDSGSPGAVRDRPTKGHRSRRRNSRSPGNLIGFLHPAIAPDEVDQFECPVDEEELIERASKSRPKGNSAR